MTRLTRSFVLLLLVSAVCLGVGLPARATTFAFKHSPNAKRLQDKHQDDLRGLLAEYKKMVDDAGGRFEIASRRHIQRYNIALQREVRGLTRDGKIDAALAVQAKVDEIKEWKVSAPDSEGVHFLNKIDLTIEGSDAATSKGVDLLVDAEKAGQLYAKQVDAAFERYKDNVAKTRVSYLESLERVRSSEQSAGRLDAVKEVMAAVKVIKALPPVEKPGKPRVIQNTNPTPPSNNNANNNTTDEEDQPDRDPSRPNIFEGVHGDDDAGTNLPPVIGIDVENEGDTPGWAGYYVIKYSINGRNGVRYVVKLDDRGSTVLFSSRLTQGNERELHNIPIELVRVDRDAVVFKHESDTKVRGNIVHRLSLTDGKPTGGRVWWSDFAFDRNDDPSQTGQVYRLGDPDADLLGLKDGVYIAEMAQVKSKANKPEFKTIKFEVTVDDGHLMISRDHRGTQRGWSDFHAFLLNVETDGKDLVMNYDRDEFSWPDTFVIDMSDPDAPVLKHWWRGDWRTRGDDPSAQGLLKLQ